MAGKHPLVQTYLPPYHTIPHTLRRVGCDPPHTRVYIPYPRPGRPRASGLPYHHTIPPYPRQYHIPSYVSHRMRHPYPASRSHPFVPLLVLIAFGPKNPTSPARERCLLRPLCDRSRAGEVGFVLGRDKRVTPARTISYAELPNIPYVVRGALLTTGTGLDAYTHVQRHM